MLALTRKKGESIIIGDNVEIIVLNLQGDQVKLGIVAPKEISVHRKEVYIQIQEENKKAALLNADSISSLKSLNLKSTNQQ